jgi:nicotinamidase/pyrazinamidase
MLPGDIVVVSSATQANKEAYSGFEDTELHRHLRDIRAERLFIGGLATDYCVLATVKDGLALRYKVFLLADAVRAVNPILRTGRPGRMRRRRRYPGPTCYESD